jgi:alpha-beta hydrolase superfamily lysophospholipase
MTSTAVPRPHPEIGTELVRDWLPSGDSRATVVLVHGLAEHSGRYERTGRLLAGAGLRVRSFDLIGAGASGGPRWDIDDWGRYHDQIESHVVFARDQGKPVVLMGHSMGGNLVLDYVMSDRVKPDMVVVSAPALGGGAGWQRALAPVVARIIPKAQVPNGVKGYQLSRDPAVGEAYFADPLVFKSSTPRLGAALFAAMDRVRRDAGSISIPTLVLHGGSDTIVPPQSTAALGDLPGFERRLYPELRHEILNEPEGPAIVTEIIAWINARI